MSFSIVKRGARQSTPKIYISKKAKTISFSAGFIRQHEIDLNVINYIRMAYDVDAKEIAVDFCKTKENRNKLEYFKLTVSKSSSSAICSINSLLSTFSINIAEIAGRYKGRSILGPIKILGFSDMGFILNSKNRETA